MTDLLTRARRVYRDEGAASLLRQGVRYGYDNHVRPILPRKTVTYNGVPVRASRVGDSIVPWQETDVDDYEGALLRGIQDHARQDDTVVVVGGGQGVSTVVAANQVEPDGTVVTYEGAVEAVDDILDTLRLNDVRERVTLERATVGEEISLWGDREDGEIVPPDELPDCDVLVLDCEGAEVTILEEMEIRPRALVVETHGMYDAPKSKVEDRIERLGYDVRDYGVAEERVADFCAENDIYVLTATASSRPRSTS